MICRGGFFFFLIHWPWPLLSRGGGDRTRLPELVAFLQSRGIARFKLPERLELVGEFPISPAGKVLRRELRERIAMKIAREHAERAAAADGSKRG